MSEERATATTAIPSHDWTMPVDPATPCGADLEYDPEFVVLFARTIARSEVQYGDFVGMPEPINWGDVERDCRRLMMRSKDIRLAVLFTRCRTNLNGAAGLAEGLGLLAAWLTAFPDTIHPQLEVDADREAALEIRKNALQALTDTDGLLADVRDISLARSSVARLQVRDVERAFAQPRPDDALAADSVSQQLEVLRAQQPAVIAGFDQALHNLRVIEAWNRAQLDGMAADFSGLERVFEIIAGDGVVAVPAAAPLGPVEEAVAVEPEPVIYDATNHEPPSALPPSAPGIATESTRPNRAAAVQRIREARHWFETEEPSSPVSVLLRRAEQLVGKRYSEIVGAIPAALLDEWEKDQ